MGKGDGPARKIGCDGMQRKVRKLVDSDEPVPEPESFARCYQLEALEMAKKQNTIAFLDTGAGKTLIAVMLLRSYAHFIRKPSKYIAVLLVPTVVLVQQQADVLEMHTDLKVGKFWGDMGVDFWDAEIWKEKFDQFEVNSSEGHATEHLEVFVMTPQILLNNLRHTFVKLDQIKLLIFDECHHARGKDPYACIMLEFYHPQIYINAIAAPRIFGMTASLTNTKGSPAKFGQQISDLETLMHSKVYTVENESVLAKYISFPVTKIKLYDHLDFSDKLSHLTDFFNTIKMKHMKALHDMRFDTETVHALIKKLEKLYATFLFCLKELGLWLTIKASDSLSTEDHSMVFWGQCNNRISEQIIRKFSQDSCSFFSRNIPAGWCIGKDLQADVEAGYLTTKVTCLVRTLLEYRIVKNLRCIVFVERVVTAIVLQSLLCQLKELSGWGIQYMAGNRFGLQSQTRNQQINIVDEFRDGNVNIIIATQILEEGLDVQSCNLVVRFDPAANVCSFIQSRGRARMQGSDYLLIVRSDDDQILSQVQGFLKSGDIMRREALRQASIPCEPMKNNKNISSYRVETTGSVVNLNSSVALINFYCSRLPSDSYFKPNPRFIIDENSDTCTLYLPKSCPLPYVRTEGICSIIRQIVCLEACKQLHQIGALSDHLIPVIGDAIEDVNERGDQPCTFEEDSYFPAELVSSWSSFCSVGQYHCYKISMSSVYFENSLCDIFLVVKSDLGSDFESNLFNLETSHGSLIVKVIFSGYIHLDHEQVFRARRFQVSVLSLLIQQNYDNFLEALRLCMGDASNTVAYLLIPSVNGEVDWACVDSPAFFLENRMPHLEHCCSPKLTGQLIQINNGFICRCMLHHSVVYTPHNNNIFCITGILDEMDIDSSFKLRSGEIITYRKYFFTRHGLSLKAEGGPLLAARKLFTVHNFLTRNLSCNEKVLCSRVVELPAELCKVLITPISMKTLRTFTFIPSVMHRLQSMLLAARLKKIQLDCCMENETISTLKVLEAITTRKCREEFSLESIETVGDSFLKYVTSSYLFKMHKNYHQGLLTARKEKMISNYALCRLGRSRNLAGFIRTEEHDPKLWFIPGQKTSFSSGDHMPSTMAWSNIHITGKRFIKTKVIADSVEALIGAYLISGGEVPALFFLIWLGLEINEYKKTSIERPIFPSPELYINVNDLQLLLNYTFHDPSLLLEALTHGSYQVPDIPRCYQRLEYLGDAVLDYLLTMHLYNDNPGATPGLLTDLRSASVNNDCFAHAAAKAGFAKNILHASSELHRHMTFYLDNISKSFDGSSTGWEAGVSLPKVLADVFESIAGAIYLDSGCNKETVWKSVRPLLEPLVNPSTMEIHPVRELEELCSHYSYTKYFSVECTSSLTSVTVEVEADGRVHRATSIGINKKVAKKQAVQKVLPALKQTINA